MKAVIFAGGDIKNYEAIKKYLEKTDWIICADSGVDHAFNMEVVPDLVVGDMDSISEESLKKLEILGIGKHSYPREKDFTDTELALEVALEKGVTEAVLLAGIGDRPDHSLANIFLMVYFKKRGLELKLIDEKWEMFLIQGEREIYGEKGDILSLIPLSPKVVGVETEDLYYPLKKETLPMGPARGISNVFLGKKAGVRVEEGLLLAVHYHAR